MQRYHLPIISLGLVSTLICYLVITQKSPFIIDTDTQEVALNVTNLAYLTTALFLALFSWISILWYILARLRKPHWHARLQMRTGLKFGFLVGIGVLGTGALRISQTLNFFTGILLWATLIAIAWTTKRREE